MLTLELHLGESPLPTFTVDMHWKTCQGGGDKEEAGDMIRNSQAKNKNPCSRKHSPDGRGVNTIPSVFGFRNNTNKNLILIYHYNHS